LNAFFISGRLQSKNGEINWDLVKRLSKLENTKFFLSLSLECLDSEIFSKVVKILDVGLDCIHIENVKVPSFIFNLKKRPETSYEHCYKQFYHNRKNIENIINYERAYGIKFDRICKFRIDAHTSNFCPPDILKENTIYVPQINNYCGLNDQYAIADSNSMRKYCLLVNFIYEYCAQNAVLYNPEILLNYHLQNMRLNIETFNFVYKLL
jgi:hypothetical protein